jgi:hypothetical protein
MEFINFKKIIQEKKPGFLKNEGAFLRNFVFIILNKILYTNELKERYLTNNKVFRVNEVINS